ncbi:ATPase-like, ATP-binding domain protein [Akanthomyces lecanii RCEF 1005]|uniref:histidine kinase n=1 Tax=Akanthomyces lecanii RCEF 1005 TaxID=1081108 RepID=A0A167THJ2_CORDF|nr:ATPase-like, ATP-binding domain protein [Akanthomyces lecanii RCEF 1005]
MRVPIWVQLALLISAVALLALTVVAVPIWVYVQSFIVNVETDSLALTASLYATKIDSQLQLLNTISRRTVSTRILIQQSLVNYYNANATTKDPFEPTVTDLQSTLATSSFTGLLQARIYSRNQTGESPKGLISVTGSVAAANSFLDIQTAVGGFGSTGVALLVTPDDPSNRFTPPLSPSNKTYQPPTGSLSNYPVKLVLVPTTYPGQTDRHQDEQGNWSLSFLLSRYPAIYGVYSTYNGKLNNARATTTNKNEHGYSVAVGVARPQTTLVDWAIVVEKSRDEAYCPISMLRKILIGCAFGTAGFVMLLIIPCAYFSVRPIRRLMIATVKSVTVPGYDLTYSDDEENAARSGGTLSFTFIKGLFKSIMRVYSKPPRPPTQSEIENHRRVFKIPGRVKERSHLITDEVTELTEVYNKMTDELVRQYTSLDQQVEKRTRELEISKKAAEAANESKTLFIANISHELKTPLNGIMGELLLHLLDDLLSFSKNQISHDIRIEHKEFRLGEVRSQVMSIFDKQAKERKIDLDVTFSGPASADPNNHCLLVQQGSSRLSQPNHIHDMYVLGDQHKILQVIINLVSNSLKFTTAGGRIQVRIRWGDEVTTKIAPNLRPLGDGSRSQSCTNTNQTTSSSSLTSKAASPIETGLDTPSHRELTKDLHFIFAEEVRSSQMLADDVDKTYLFTSEVEDTGRVIPKNMQEKIFEPFVQVDSSFSKKFGGTGLGLSICSQLAKLLGGRVTVRSSEGLGSTFSLKIPLKYIIDRLPSTRPESIKARSRSTSADGSLTGGAGGSSRERNSLSSVLAQEPDQMTTTTSNTENHKNDIQPRLVGLSTPFFPPNPNQPFAPPAKSIAVVPQIKSGETQADKQEIEADKFNTSGSDPTNSDLLVLVADDNATNIEVLRRMLKLEKVLDVTIAKDGREAYELVKANMKRNRKFDLIFMDVQMPNLDGIQSTKLIRQMGYAAPVVALTAFSEESNRKQCMESGMDEFLAKPIRRSALKSVLAKLATLHEEKTEKK